MSAPFSTQSAGEGACDSRREMVDDLPIPVRITDLTGHARYFNEAWFQARGGSWSDELGLGWQDSIHPEDRPSFLSAFSQAAAQKLPYQLRYRWRDRHGAYRSILERGNPTVFTGSPAYLSTALDLSDPQVQPDTSASSQAGATQILEATTDFVAVADRHGHVLYFNPAARRTFPWLLEQSGQPPRHLRDIHPAWVDDILFDHAIPYAIAHGTWRGETAVLDAQGQEIAVSQVLIAHRGPDGKPEAFSTIMREISRNREEEIARVELANRYDAAIRASGQLLFDWNSSTNEIVYGGDTAPLLGYRFKEMVGGLERFRSLIEEEDRPAFDAEIARVTATREPFRVGFRLRRKNGELIWVDAKGYFFLDRQGQIGRMVGFLADVTESQRAREQLAKAHEYLEQRVEERTAELERTYGVIKDRAMQQGSVAHLGQRALAGAPLQELFDEATELVRTTLKVDLCAVLQLASDGLSLKVNSAAGWPSHANQKPISIGYHSQAGYTLVIGEPVIVEDMATERRFHISDPVREIGAVSGITVIIQSGNQPFGVLAAMATLQRFFTQDDAHFLQSIANVLTAAIDQSHAAENIRLAQEQAEAANRAKSVFLSRMSHELRTPLNAILGFSELLQLDQPTARQAESLFHITRGGQHLLSMINEVLDIARIDVGQFAISPQPFELNPLLSTAIASVAAMAERQQIALRFEPEHLQRFTVADRQRTLQILVNLLSNAIKFNRPAGSVTLSCKEINSKTLRIEVSDTGLGIAPEKMPNLFVPFERLGAESTDVEGTGVGLALSQRIAVAMQGILGVENHPGAGCTFFLELPSCPAPELELISSGLVDAFAELSLQLSSTILYVEDLEINTRLVERILKHRPEFELLACNLGQHALAMARQHQPKLILLDLNLPDINGEEVLCQLKHDPTTAAIPVIMISAEIMEARIARLLELGAAGYLTKPYKVTEFLEVLEKCLRQEALTVGPTSKSEGSPRR